MIENSQKGEGREREGGRGKFCDERHNKNFIYNDNARWIEILKACHNFE